MKRGEWIWYRAERRRLGGAKAYFEAHSFARCSERSGRPAPGHQDAKEFTGRDWKKLAAGDDGEIGGMGLEETKS